MTLNDDIAAEAVTPPPAPVPNSPVLGKRKYDVVELIDLTDETDDEFIGMLSIINPTNSANNVNTSMNSVNNVSNVIDLTTDEDDADIVSTVDTIDDPIEEEIRDLTYVDNELEDFLVDFWQRMRKLRHGVRMFLVKDGNLDQLENARKYSLSFASFKEREYYWIAKGDPRIRFQAAQKIQNFIYKKRCLLYVG